MATEKAIQEIVHKLEEGGWAKWVQLGVAIAAVAFVINLWFFQNNGVKGLKHPRAFEQAEIARELARGNGFSTRVIRPCELFLFAKNKGAFPQERIPDTYHGPLWPAILAPFVWLVRDTWVMTPKDVVYQADRVIAGVSTGFFILSIIVCYFIARRLFDARLAAIATGLLLACQLFWRFGTSGLPQMLMLFLFSCALYMFIRAIEAQIRQKEGSDEIDTLDTDGEPVSIDLEKESALATSELEPPDRSLWSGPLPWLVGVGFCFGLLAITHAMTLWIFAGLLIFSLIYFRPIGRDTLIMLLLVTAIFTPWLVRNYEVCGSPVGVSWYSGLYQIRGSDSSVMRSMDPPLSGVSPNLYKSKIQTQIVEQLSKLPAHLGNILVAPVFFLSLLHLFKRRSVAVLRWALLLMYLIAVFGMAVFGLEGHELNAQDLHVLFIPAFTFYGLAFILVLWSRLDITVKLVRWGFIAAIFLVCSIEFLASVITLLREPQSRVNWPPYVPPYIAVLNTYTSDREIIMSDMPWAVAWYADRDALWLPTTINDFIQLNDYNLLQGRIVGLYLTPVSGNAAFLGDIMKGEYKEWAPFITRNANLRNFPLRAVTALPIENECVFYADRDRWSVRED